MIDGGTALLRRQHQGKAAVAGDVDSVHRVHLHRGAQGHHSLQRLPDVDQMARQTPRRKEHHVDSDRIVRTREARGEYFRRRRDLAPARSEEHTSELQSLMRTTYAVICLKKKNTESDKYHICDGLYKDD